ncbi:hypothetical protein PtA15_6A548 [Puccinia triticina]|uniref:Uncharacterized protein n=1 Tax=Puccinia triticina TaxID=208348 RepID=A0ABY7CL12_9BASI|nr:uncharacterized protein PtA15_6A548 [Puccinia triticina]WAQ85919.1 hypothetical protein PtA15_6A548 [Puccinia triticina]WAR55813.1 hypothetical protein PtB15_6B556 [Puccinia triticina]
MYWQPGNPGEPLIPRSTGPVDPHCTQTRRAACLAPISVCSQALLNALLPTTDSGRPPSHTHLTPDGLLVWPTCLFLLSQALLDALLPTANSGQPPSHTPGRAACLAHLSLSAQPGPTANRRLRLTPIAHAPDAGRAARLAHLSLSAQPGPS